MKLYWTIFAIGLAIIILSWILRQYNEWLFIGLNVLGLAIWAANIIYSERKRKKRDQEIIRGLLK